MPHVVVKLLPGRTEQQKQELVAAIVKDLVSIADAAEESVSVAIEEVEQKEWNDKVYQREILPVREKLYKKPGYDRPKGRS